MKCEFKGCNEDATCRAPKDRTLKSYWNFCKKHAAEYNQNWDFYKGMTDDEIEKDWEKRTFGYELEKDIKTQNYKNIINDILSGKIDPESVYKTNKTTMPANVVKAFDALGITPTTDSAKIKKAYLALAKKYHPDKSEKGGDRFKMVSEAFQTIEKYFKGKQ